MSSILTVNKIILASNSETRKSMLEKTGIRFTQIKSSIDEEGLKKNNPELNAKELGLLLASEKAIQVSEGQAHAYVIGADQVCEFNSEFLDKPGSIENCIKHLSLLSGKTHFQNCATVIAHNGKIIWQHHALAKLTMRKLSQDEIRAYVELEQPINSCGSYMFEKHGKHLFNSVEGSDDIILGLAIVELLAELYRLNIIELT